MRCGFCILVLHQLACGIIQVPRIQKFWNQYYLGFNAIKFPTAFATLVPNIQDFGTKCVFYTRTIYIIVYYVSSSVVENHHYISTPLDETRLRSMRHDSAHWDTTPLDETLKRWDDIGLVKGIMNQ